MEDNSKKSRRGLALGVSVAAVAAVLGIAAVSSPNPSTSTNSQAQPAAAIGAFAPAAATPETQETATQSVQSEPQSVDVQSVQSEQGSDLSNNNHYTNSSGNTVHAPAYDLDSDVPAGASAHCSNGTYSFSQHHSGICSHHGWVSKWLQ